LVWITVQIWFCIFVENVSDPYFGICFFFLVALYFKRNEYPVDREWEVEKRNRWEIHFYKIPDLCADACKEFFKTPFTNNRCPSQINFDTRWTIDSGPQHPGDIATHSLSSIALESTAQTLQAVLPYQFTGPRRFLFPSQNDFQNPAPSIRQYYSMIGVFNETLWVDSLRQIWMSVVMEEADEMESVVRAAGELWSLLSNISQPHNQIPSIT
jgi:hypothetical protein